MTDEHASRLLLTLKAALPHGDASVDPLQARARDEIYRAVFLGWNLPPAQEAVQACLLASRFYPSLAELHEAYTAASRSRPERARSALPPKDGTQASAEEVQAACAAALELVKASAVVPPARTGRRPRPAPGSPATIAETPAASPEAESEMIARTVEREKAREKAKTP